MTAFSRLSRFGMTFKPLTADRGAKLLTLYLEDFPVRTFLPLDEAQASKEPDRECGSIWPESLAKYDPATSLWKTAQCSLLEDSIEFSETWPRWGSMQDGVSYQQQTLVHHIRETGSGLWPTPLAQDAKHSGYAQSGPGKADKLSYAAARWPTPTTMDCIHRSRESWEKAQNRPRQGKNLIKLGDIGYWPTPTAHNAKETNAPSESQRNTPTLAAQAGGTLNPTWVEWLMGWPLGWTDLKPLEMDKYQQWQQQHGIY
jgi:hypothetical protein